jgi:type I restriction enzyme, S subunit
MKSNYKRLGDLIKLVNSRNSDGLDVELLGINIDKFFMPSVANVVGTDLTKYKLVEKNQFACNRMHVGRDYRIPIAMSRSEASFIVSPAYTVFEIIDTTYLLPEYLLMWFMRSEFDRECWFHTDADVRGGLPWELFSDIELPIPSIEKQREIVAEYNTVVNRIKLNEKLNQKLEETAQALYKYWFVDFEFPNENGQPNKSSGGNMVWNEELDKEIPEGWEVVNLKRICSKIGSGSTPRGGRDAYHEEGISLIRSLNVHDFLFAYSNLARINDNQAKKLDNVKVAEKDILLNITGVSVARCCMVPADILPARVNQHVSIIRLIDEIGSPYYFLSALCSTEYKAQLLGVSDSGSTRQAITKAEIENLEILLPCKTPRDLFDSRIKILFEHREIISKENNSLELIAGLILAKMTKVEIEKATL